MGLFSGIKNNFKKSEAAVVVENLLERQAAVGFLEVDAATLANNLVARIWKQEPDWFNGVYGQRPHKISVAAAALAHGTQLIAEGDTSRTGMLLALGVILSELEKNGRLYPLNGIDEELLEYAVGVFSDEADIEPDKHEETDGLNLSVDPDCAVNDDEMSRKDAAAAFLDDQMESGAMTQEQFDIICRTLSMSSMMTGNLQEAYEIAQGKPVPGEEFDRWLDEHPEGRQWKAMWVLLRKGQPDSAYKPA